MEEEVKKRNAEVIQYLSNQNWEKLAEVYAPDASLGGPYGPAVHGRQEVLAGCKQAIDHPNHLHLVGDVDVKILSDEWACSNCTTNMTGGDGAVVGEFKDIVLWQKVAGQWFMVKDYFSYRSEEPKKSD